MKDKLTEKKMTGKIKNGQMKYEKLTRGLTNLDKKLMP
jgi:hypothetical protein